VSGDALTRMRAELRSAHDRLERTIALDGAGASRDRYAAFVERMLGFVEPCEARLRAAAGTPPGDLAARWKAPLLRSTLAALGVAGEAIDRLPRAGALPPLARWPDAYGYLYVLEGSTLGGQVLLRELGGRLSLTEGESAFLRAYGPAVAPMWRQMLAQLESAMAEPAAERAITATARDTFALLDDWYRSDPRFR
jgi:heme oxygenase